MCVYKERKIKSWPPLSPRRSASEYDQSLMFDLSHICAHCFYLKEQIHRGGGGLAHDSAIVLALST